MSSAPSVLIVDDDPALLDALPAAIKLRMPEICVSLADSAGSALEQIARVDYDVIVTDIKMPGMDGLQLLEEIGELRPETPTLLISGHGERDLTIRAIRGGAYDFIQKPIDRDYFMAAIRRALQARELRRENAAQRAELESHAAHLEATVAARTRELQRAAEAKDEFLGMISHEMRTPLTLISGGTQILRQRDDVLDPGERRALLQDVESEAVRLSRMVEDLLVLARTQFGETTSVEPVSLPAVAQRVVDGARRWSTREISILIERDLPPLAAEETYLERIITNLISNADKYSHTGQPLRVVATRGDIMGEVRVIDQGPGVQQDELDLIFERFFRSPESAGRVAGVGMGLTVCKRLVEAMSGYAWARHRDDGFEVGFAVPLYTHEHVEAPRSEALEAAL